MADSDQPTESPLSELVLADVKRSQRRRRVYTGTLAAVAVLVGLLATGVTTPKGAAEFVLRQDFDLEARTAPIDPNEPGAALVVVARPEIEAITAYAEPDIAAEPVSEFVNETDFPLHFLATLDFDAFAASPTSDSWVEVRLPIRPNGSTGWLQLSEIDLYENPYRIEIDTGDHQLTVFKNNELFDEATVAIGAGETPTPIGHFYITDLYEVPIENSVYGPYAFGLSGFSDVLTAFEGGEAIVGLHGTNDPRSLGTDVSHGCVRVPNDVITRLADTLPLGTPVIIVESR